jgi:hypothetical protein
MKNNIKTNLHSRVQEETTPSQEWYKFEWSGGKMISYYEITTGDVSTLLTYLKERYSVREIEPKRLWAVVHNRSSGEKTEGKLQKVSPPNGELQKIIQSGGFSQWPSWNHYDSFEWECNRAIERIRQKIAGM